MIFRIAAYLILISVAMVSAQAPDTLWTRMYGSTFNDEAWQLKQIPDGGFIVVGSGSADGKIYLLKTDENGDTLWTNLLGFTIDDIGRSVEPLDDGGFIITGYAFGNILLMKIDSLGNYLWHHYLSEGYGRSVRVTENGHFVIAGYTPAFNFPKDMFIARTDSNGDTIWTKTYGSGNYANEVPWDIRETNDGGLIIVGWSGGDLGGESDIYVLRLNSNGDSLWSRTYGGVYNDEGRSIIVKEEGGYLIAGKLSYQSGASDIAVVSIDFNGDSVWTKTYSGIWINANSICPTSDGGYILTGIGYYTGQIFSSCIIKIDSNGDSLWTKALIDSTENLYCRSIVQTSDGGYVVAGYGWNSNNHRDVYICKLAPDITYIDKDIEIIPTNLTLCQSYPNPFNASTTIRFTLPQPQNVNLTVYDLPGRQVENLLDEYKQAGVHTVTFDGTNLSSGVYFFRLQAGGMTETKRMVLLK